jgi:hypothetical protein
MRAFGNAALVTIPMKTKQDGLCMLRSSLANDQTTSNRKPNILLAAGTLADWSASEGLLRISENFRVLLIPGKARMYQKTWA